MADTKSIVVGMDALQAKLDALPLYVEKPLLKKAARTAMQLVASKAAEYAPKKTGALAAAIKVRAGKASQGGFSVLAAASRRWFTGKTFYGAFQEFGWKAGARKRSIETLARRLSRQIRGESRALRVPGTNYGLAKKGTEFRVRQEKYFYYTGLKKARAMQKERRQIPGKHFVQRAFDETAQSVLDQFTASAEAAIKAETQGK